MPGCWLCNKPYLLCCLGCSKIAHTHLFNTLHCIEQISCCPQTLSTILLCYDQSTRKHLYRSAFCGHFINYQSGAPNGSIVKNIYPLDIVSWLAKSAEQTCCYFHNNAHCMSNWRTATECETISNHVISSTPLNRSILWRNPANWLASSEHIFAHFKCLL